nr:MAG TPA: hypothetical protein [Caudoviricetes sp.]
MRSLCMPLYISSLCKLKTFFKIETCTLIACRAYHLYFICLYLSCNQISAMSNFASVK